MSGYYRRSYQPPSNGPHRNYYSQHQTRTHNHDESEHQHYQSFYQNRHNNGNSRQWNVDEFYNGGYYNERLGNSRHDESHRSYQEVVPDNPSNQARYIDGPRTLRHDQKAAMRDDSQQKDQKRPSPTIRYDSEFFKSKYHYFDPISQRLIHRDEMSSWRTDTKIPSTGYVLIQEMHGGQPRSMMKERHPEETSSDPRIKDAASSTFRKCRDKLTSLPRISYDKYSIGPPPPSEVIVMSASDVNTTQDISVKNYFRRYGEISHFEPFTDPNNALPLHAYLIRYTSSEGKLNDASEAAYMAVKDYETKGCFILGSKFNVQLNKDNFIQKVISKLVDENLRKANKIQSEIKRKNELLQTQTTKMMDKTTETSNQQERKIPLDIVKLVNNRPVLFVSKVFSSYHGFRGEDFKLKLRRYRWSRILDHHTGIFIIFNDIEHAKSCMKVESGKMTIISRSKRIPIEIKLQLIPPKIPDIAGKSSANGGTNSQQSFKPKMRVFASKQDLIKAATQYILEDLEKALHVDIRKRLIGPTVFDSLNPSSFPELIAKKEIKEQERQEAAAKAAEEIKRKQTTANDFDIFNLYGSVVPTTDRNVLKRRRPSSSDKMVSRTKKHSKITMPMAHMLNDDSTSKEQTPLTTSTSPFTEFERDEMSSSSATSSDNEIDYDQVSDQKDKAAKLENEPVTSGLDHNTKPIVLAGKVEELMNIPERYRPMASESPEPVFRDDTLEQNLSLIDFLNTVKDTEDLGLLRKILDVNVSNEDSKLDSKLEYNVWKLRFKDENQRSAEEAQSRLNEVPFDIQLQSRHGSVKAEGFRRVPDRLKSCYLPHRRKIHQPLNTVSHHTDSADGTPEVLREESESIETSESTLQEVSSSRDNRASNRRFQQDMEAQRAAIGTESELLSLNQLNKRKKPVTFARSAIHNWGLYALEPIAAKEMIIEYVGERIRQPVAEMREVRYLKNGIGSSYLFRVDENTVIDATKKGGIARFINHCCDPSCTAKIIKVGGKKRIVIYALRDIASNEELTYDYKFEREIDDEERLRCLCGAPSCKGFLN